MKFYRDFYYDPGDDFEEDDETLPESPDDCPVGATD